VAEAVVLEAVVPEADGGDRCNEEKYDTQTI
jgi:hypothetical protein